MLDYLPLTLALAVGKNYVFHTQFSLVRADGVLWKEDVPGRFMDQQRKVAPFFFLAPLFLSHLSFYNHMEFFWQTLPTFTHHFYNYHPFHNHTNNN